MNLMPLVIGAILFLVIAYQLYISFVVAKLATINDYLLHLWGVFQCYP